MKKLSVLFLSLVAVATTITSCHSDSPAATPAATALELTVKEYTGGTAVSGATVTLYASLDDLNNQKNPIGTAPSDASGVVTFNKNLKSAVYYFDVVKGCENNSFTTYQTAAALVASTTTKLDVKVLGTATLTISNTSTTDSYNLYLVMAGKPDTQLGNAAIAPGQQAPMSIPAGMDYTFKAQKVDPATGNLTADPAITKLVNIACGGTDTFAFPQ